MAIFELSGFDYTENNNEQAVTIIDRQTDRQARRIKAETKV